MRRTHDTTGIESLLGHRAWLRTLATHLVAEGEVDDVLQQTWMAALRSGPPPDDRPSRPWLATVLRNVVRMNHRSATRRKRREEVVSEDCSAPASPEQVVARVRLERRLAGLVTRLDEPFRTTILLRYYEGLSAAEIARRQEVAAGTVRWRVFRGLEHLRLALDRESDGDRAAWSAAFVPLLTKEAAPGGSVVVTTQGAVAVKAKIATLSLAGVMTLGAAVAVAGTSDTSDTSDTSVEPTEDPDHDDTPVAFGQPEFSEPRTEAVRGGALPRLNPRARRALIAAMEAARDERATRAVPDDSTGPASDADRRRTATKELGELDERYIREQVQQLTGVFEECYEQALERSPGLTGKLMVQFAIVGEPDVGGLVETSEIDPEQSTIVDPDLIECVRESTYTMQFPPPDAGGRVIVHYPIRFAPEDPAPGED